MRLVYKLYGDGERHALIETDDDGSNPRLVEGVHPPPCSDGPEMAAFIEVSCDEGVINKVRAALRQIQKRLSAAPSKLRSDKWQN